MNDLMLVAGCSAGQRADEGLKGGHEGLRMLPPESKDIEPAFCVFYVLMKPHSLIERHSQDLWVWLSSERHAIHGHNRTGPRLLSLRGE